MNMDFSKPHGLMSLYSESESFIIPTHIPTVGSFPFDLHGLPGAANHVPATCLGSVKNEQRAAALWIRGPMAHQKTTESADYWNIEVSGQQKNLLVLSR
jgi:hypothetical protein